MCAFSIARHAGTRSDAKAAVFGVAARPDPVALVKEQCVFTSTSCLFQPDALASKLTHILERQCPSIVLQHECPSIYSQTSVP